MRNLTLRIDRAGRRNPQRLLRFDSRATLCSRVFLHALFCTLSIRLRPVFTTTLFALLACTPAYAQHGPPPGATVPTTPSLLKRALDAWKTRQETVRSLKFEWTFKSFRPAEEQRRRAEDPFVKRQLKVRPADLRELDVTQQRAFILDGGRTRYEEHGPVNLGGTNECWDRDKFSVFNGKTYVQLVPNSFSLKDRRDYRYPAADLQDQNEEVFSANLVPLFLLFRPFDRSLQNIIDPHKLQIDPISSPAKPELSCRERNWQFVLDPERDYVITKYSQLDHARTALLYEASIDYTRAPNGIWVPQHWHSLFLTSDGQLRAEEDSTITRYELNPSLSQTTFELELPANAYVRDLRNGERQYYIQRADGSRLPILPQTLYRDAMAQLNGPTRADSASWSRARIMLIVALNGGAVSIVAALWLYRRRKRSL